MAQAFKVGGSTGGGASMTSTIRITCVAAGDSVSVTDGISTVTGTAAADTMCSIDVPNAGTWRCYVNGNHWGKVVVYGYGTYIREAPRFGYCISAGDSNPPSRVTYLYDAEGMIPASMNFATGVFNYGDWGDFQAVRENYPVMLRYDGTEDYKLDPNDYTKKEDGVTASDVSNTAYAGNAMAAFSRMWVYRYMIGSNRYAIYCPIQYDANYKADAFVNHDGNCMEKFYMPCFKGATISNVLRSIKGQTPNNSLTAPAELTQARANNPAGVELWETISHSRREFVKGLLILLGKSTETQGVFGMGSVTHGSAATSLCTTGSISNKGQFWGSNVTGQKVQHKVFHMEGFWGDRWDRIVGLVNDNGAIKVKMTPPYSLDNFAGYIAAGITPGGTNGGYISACKMSDLGDIPTTASGSATTYEADGFWYNNAIVAIALVGCSCSSGYAAALSGAFPLIVYYAASSASWHFGASPSCDMPSAA